ncbi:haloacid dehalogenase-like hydrolase family protein [Acinetobacter baumannii]|nr:haloacid dehalogenase-like hydrolase family protein [Acinetobacter baumannii]
MIYQYFLNQLKCRPNEVIFIGDTQIADVDGPQELGMSAQIIDRRNGEKLANVLKGLI